ncbi:MAG TPA: hypothetical protein PLF40_00905 [Kofleriaceae bacterium]|nr:hypothetical protein [Kofleriaceae bacterium]
MKNLMWGGWITTLACTVACTKNNPTFCETNDMCPTDMQCSTEKYCTDGFTLDTAPFHTEGDTLWSATAAPALQGYIVDGGAEIKLFDGDIEVAGPATVTNNTWHLDAPALLKDGETKQLRIVQTNHGAHVELLRNFAGDLTAPTARVEPSQSNDESKDVVTWNTDGTPQHAHQPFPIVIDGSHCADLPRYQHLFATGTPYAIESAPNPMALDVRAKARFPFTTASRFRVLKDAAPLIDWSPITSTTAEDETAATLAIANSTSPAFGDKSGAYVAEYEFVDWAGRTATTQACWNIQLLPPPLEISARANTTDARSLPTWRYGTQSTGQLSTIVTGAAPVTLYERTFRNGTAVPVEFEVKIANNETINVTSRAEPLRDAEEIFNVPLPPAIGSIPCTGTYCDTPLPQAYPALPAPKSAASQNPLPWKLKLVDGTGAEITPCTYIDDETQRCTLPGRAPGAAPTSARAIATITQITTLNPTGAALFDSSGLSENATVNRDRCLQRQGYVVGNCVAQGNCPFACVRVGLTTDHMRVTSVNVEISGNHNGSIVKPDFAMTSAVVGESRRAQVAGAISFVAGKFLWNGQ